MKAVKIQDITSGVKWIPNGKDKHRLVRNGGNDLNRLGVSEPWSKAGKNRVELWWKGRHRTRFCNTWTENSCCMWFLYVDDAQTNIVYNRKLRISSRDALGMADRPPEV